MLTGNPDHHRRLHSGRLRRLDGRRIRAHPVLCRRHRTGSCPGSSRSISRLGLGHMILRPAQARRQSSRCLRHAASTADFARPSAGPCAHRIIVLVMTLMTLCHQPVGRSSSSRRISSRSRSRPEILVDLWLPEGSSIKGGGDAGQGARSQNDGRQGQALHRHLYSARGAPRFFLPLDQQLRNPKLCPAFW